jgi:hypothetical protein
MQNAMVSGLRSNVYEDRLKELGLTTLEERRHQADMLQMYKLTSGHDQLGEVQAAHRRRLTHEALCGSA